MLNKLVIAMFVLMIAMSWSVKAEVTEVYWKGLPITISIKTGEERTLIMPGQFDIHVPANLIRNVSVQSLKEFVHITPDKAFPKTRFMLENRQTKDIYLVDIVSSPSGGVVPIRFNDLTKQKPKNEVPQRSKSGKDLYHELVQTAFQQLYSPERLIQKPSGFVPASYPKGIMRHLYRGANVSAKAVGSWRFKGLYVTAIELSNITNQEVNIDARDFRGTWLARAGLGSGYTLSANRPHNLAVFMLVSDRPFSEAYPYFAGGY